MRVYIRVDGENAQFVGDLVDPPQLASTEPRIPHWISLSFPRAFV